MMARVQPPRSAFLNFPLGRQCGKPNDPELQKKILRSTLEVLVNASNAGEIVDLPYEWGTPYDWKTYWQDLDEMIKEEGIQVQEWKQKG